MNDFYWIDYVSFEYVDIFVMIGVIVMVDWFFGNFVGNYWVVNFIVVGDLLKWSGEGIEYNVDVNFFVVFCWIVGFFDCFGVM